MSKHPSKCEVCGESAALRTQAVASSGTRLWVCSVECYYVVTGKAHSIAHPTHYTAHPSKVECIAITEHMNFCLGNAIKYIWRADLKGGSEDLEKARWYITRELERRNKDAKRG